METEEIKNYIKSSKREFLFSFVFSLLFSVLFMFGRNIDKYGTLFIPYNKLPYIILFIISAITMFFIYKKLLPCLQKFVTSNNLFSKINKLFFEDNKKSFIAVFLFILIMHIPAFLAYFPGLFTYDTFYQANFFINHDYIEKDPVIHSFLVYLTLLFSKKFNTDIWGVFIYTVIQSGIIFLIWSYSIKIMAKYKTPNLINLFALLFFAFYPTHQVFPLIATKDTLFCNFVFLFVILTTELILEKEKFINSNKKYWLYIFVIILVLLFRPNGIFIFLIIPFIMFYLYKQMKTKFVKLVLLLLIPILFFFGFNTGKEYFNVKAPRFVSSLNIPMQQMGRVRLFQDNILSKEDKEIFCYFVEPSQVLEYNPYIADYMLVDELMSYDYIENAMKQKSKQYWDLYLKWAKLYPKDYVDAFLNMNYGYWYFAAKYRIVDLHYYLYTENRWNNFFGIKISMHSLNKPLQEFYNNIFIGNSFEKNPITFMMFGIGVNTWFILFCLFVLAYKKRYDLILALSLVLALFISAQFGAIVLLRYIYTDFIIVPLLIAFCFSDKENKIWYNLPDKKEI